MADTPNEAATPAPAEATVATPNNSNPEPVQAPNQAQQSALDLGLSAEQAQKFKTFIENSGGFDNAFAKLKSDISTPKSAQPAPEQPKEPTSQPQAQPVEPQYKAPEGSITPQEFLAQQYFQNLSRDPKYEAISQGIANGDYLKEMAAFGISALNRDGSINDQKVRMYLDLKAQTVPAKGTSSTPDASTAPTVDYYQISGDTVSNMADAYAILEQDIKLQASGQGHHPKIQEAEAFIKSGGKPAEKK